MRTCVVLTALVVVGGAVGPDAEIITGSFTDEENHTTWEWSLHRVER